MLLYELGVDEDFRRKGIGRALAVAMRDYAQPARLHRDVGADRRRQRTGDRHVPIHRPRRGCRHASHLVGPVGRRRGGGDRRTERVVSWIERMLEERLARAAADGELDTPHLAGKPLPDIDTPRQQGWWAEQFVRRELSHDRRVAAETAAAEARAGLLEGGNDRRSARTWWHRPTRRSSAPTSTWWRPTSSQLFDWDDVAARWRALPRNGPAPRRSDDRAGRRHRANREVSCNHFRFLSACYNEMIQQAAVSATVEFEAFFSDRYRLSVALRLSADRFEPGRRGDRSGSVSADVPPLGGDPRSQAISDACIDQRRSLVGT